MSVTVGKVDDDIFLNDPQIKDDLFFLFFFSDLRTDDEGPKCLDLMEIK